MVITVTCPSCSSSFPVDSAKIPEGGVKGRCTSCKHVFRIEKPAAEVASPPAPPAREPELATPLPPLPTPEPVAAPPKPAPPEPAPAPTPPKAEPAAAPAEAGVSGFRFGKRDPTDKAKRLARVLVSDMIMYNADRHRTALENGTLKADFEDEIGKSWKEFVDQVGADLADGPGKAFWQEALNDILAKGEKLF